MKRFTVEEKEFMINNQHLPFSEIAEILNRPPSSIRAFLNNQGIYHKKEFNPNLNDFLENYNLYNMSELMELYNVSKKTLYKFMDKNNIPRKRQIKHTELEVKNKLKKQKEIYYSQIRYDYFEKIDNPQKAYYLGLIASDGNINIKRHLLSITLHEEDGYILNDFYKELNTNRKTTKERGKYSRFQISLFI